MGTNEGKIAGHYERSELELIGTIMRYMGKRQNLLIRKEKKGGRKRPSLVRRTETGKFTISYARFWAAWKNLKKRESALSGLLWIKTER